MARNAGPEIAATCAQAEQNQERLATSEGTVLHHPETVPDVTLVAADGSRRGLRELIAGRPAVLLFFRGDWCPFSTTSMRALEDIRADLASQGIAMIGITPRHHSALAGAVERNLLGYPLLTDPELELTEAMGVRVRVIDEMVHLYEKQGIDLAELNESGEWSLPLEATFLVGPDGRICCANAFPHPSRRMEPAEVRERMLEMLGQCHDA
ncbi:peroxiredoxin-like family protein [Oricola thermophila]|uniref:AhpC/TSA family protein n=1 Tax=Oricola thermophila TaxID=2742145 RepID=A0A6N1VHW7_9HYPH|nr:peroxiredoxin-like family protein [Oricola thermophila]QKV18587.1 AhpC/TSA family protein [Oricola thermophila]